MTCNATVVSAFNQGQLGFAFSDSGWLMPWYFGVIYTLQKLGIITQGITPIGAVSGGSVAASTSCLGLDYHQQVMPAVHATAKQCRAQNMCAGTLDSVMGPSLRALISPVAANSSALAQCGKTSIYVSAGRPKIQVKTGPFARGVKISGSKPRLVDNTDPQHFVDGIVASWFIPYYWSSFGAWTSHYDGQPAYEGYFTLPTPCPPGAELCVRIASRYPGPLVAKEKPWDSVLKAFMLWEAQPLMPAHADIYPGKYNPCKYTAFELSATLSITPGTDEDLDYLFELGQRDAMSWAEDMGLAGNKQC